MKCLSINLDDQSSFIIHTAVKKIHGLSFLDHGFYNLEDALFELSQKEPDLIFINHTDIQALSDFLVRTAYEPMPSIIVVGEKKEEAADAFEADAIDFLLSPFDTEHAEKAILKAIHSRARLFSIKNDAIFVRTEFKMYEKVMLKDIRFVQALSDYVMIFTKQKKYTIHSTMKNILMHLPEEDFARVHHSYIVSVNNIDGLDHDNVIVGGTEIPVSKMYLHNIRARLPLL